ncbi:MAG: molybdopterin-dependent oxidoreductase [Chloroflexi bacterium]|nr:molybdopterin-dependent oxidoreductase [Chloroflexota bacterium]
MGVLVKEEIVRTNCRGCHGGCGVLVHVRDGTIIKIEGDPDFPTNHGSMCSKGLAFQQLVYHPDRVKYPLKRVGKKGEGKWQRISWDEAFDTIVNKLKQVIKENGPESIVLAQGTSREGEAFLARFGNLLGTPNVMAAGHFCYLTRVGASLVTCGNLPICDYDGNPNCVVVWGSNIFWTNPDEYTGENLCRVLAQGAKLIVVDPRLTYTSSRADVWLQLRPGTDAALAFGMLNVIISEKLYDKEFVEKYTHGWDKFVERVKQYPVEKVAEITWVPADKIIEAARLFAKTKPATIQWGISIEQNINCIDSDRLLIDLLAITGNLDVKGGGVFFLPPKGQTISQFTYHKELPPEQSAKYIAGDAHKLCHMIGLVPENYVYNAVLTGKPYPVRAILLQASNPVVTRPNAKMVYKALSQVEFLSVADFFLTPTAELADVFLPSATWLEVDYTGGFFFRHGYLFPRKKIVQIGECKSDFEIWNELGRRMGQKQWGANHIGDLDQILAPGGVTWADVRDKPFLRGEVKYRKYLEKGFSTPTRKVELYCTTFEKWGYDPLPTYKEVPESPVSNPELAKQYPYILITGPRSPVFFHSEHRMIPWLRECHPDPMIDIHPDTAKKHGIKEGDWVYIESPRGRIKQRARFNPGIHPQVVCIQHGWWFPEIKTPDHGWDLSNSNILTDNDPKTLDIAFGASNLRTLMCKIYPVKQEEAK